MIKKNNIEIFFYVPILMIFLPIILMGHQMWDGVIIDYNVNYDISVIKNWFYSTRWPYQFWQIYFFYNISKILNISYALINGLAVAFSLFLICKEVYLILVELFKVEKYFARFSVFLVALFPSWQVLLSNVMSFHIICLALGLLGVRLTYHNRHFYKFIGYLFCLFSLGYPGNLIFIPTLAFFYEKKLTKISNYINPILILLMSILNYFGNKFFLDGGVLYNEYNSILNPFYLENIKLIFVCFLNFSSYFLPLVIPLIYYSLRTNKFLLIKIDIDLILIIFLILSAILPFLVVGKSSRISYYSEWTNRQSFPLGIPLVIFIIFYVNRIYVSLAIKKKIIYFVSIVFFIFLFLGVNNKITKYSFENDLIEQISKSISLIPPGRVCISGVDLSPKFRFYELNYLFYLATGEKVRWVDYCDKLHPSDSFEKFNSLGNFYIYDNTSKNLSNQIFISISYLNIDSFYFYKRLFGFENNKLNFLLVD